MRLGKRGLLTITALLCAPVAQTADDPGKAFEGQTAIADLHVVDCLLPGQVRQLGRRTFLTPRRPTRTTAADCRTRGGEYVAYDRADYKSALNVWLPATKGGDAEAQVNVGEIYERGLGAEPNYEVALHWYRQAADQGNSRAQFNLGTLYEQGKGVPADRREALNWYRLAWGLPEDSLVYSSAAAREQEALRAKLEEELKQKRQQIDVLTKRIEELEDSLVSSDESQAAASIELETLKGLIANLESAAAEQQTSLEEIPTGPRTREPAELLAEDREVTQTLAKMDDLELGRYYALLIANQNYDSIEDLNTPLRDIERAKSVLEDKYGFEVFVVADGNNETVMRAINDINEILNEEDNLLLFYAGHGSRLTAGDVESGYWLPANAEQPPRNTYWVPNEFVTGHLSRLKAKHVLVIADSCYAGLLSTEPSFLLLGDNAPSYSDPEFMRFKLSRKSRLLLSSGGDRPVLDGGGGLHSVFARAVLEELETNEGVLAGPQLYLSVRDKVRTTAEQNDFVQIPEFKAIKAAGHEVGDFFFVPRTLQN